MRSVICLLLPLLGAVRVAADDSSHVGVAYNGTVECVMDRYKYDSPIKEDCYGALDLVLNHTNCDGGKGVYRLKNGECTSPMTVGNCSMTVCAGANDVVEQEAFNSSLINQAVINSDFFNICIDYDLWGSLITWPTAQYPGGWNFTFFETRPGEDEEGTWPIPKPGMPAGEANELVSRDSQPDITVGNRTWYFRPPMLDDPIIRPLGDAAPANCTDNMRADFNGTDCREAINVLFNKNLWTNPFDFPASSCMNGSTPENTCTATICNFHPDERGSRYNTRELVRKMATLHYNCSKWFGKGSKWTFEQTELSFT
ncbi:hypothetical protein QBC34DRAFT_436193 [Podospora aff. communis PSN243]|uniref:Cyanovirin-N domain-containing protein n=1 Tax=Podospora aff. communis PSN243 TaxID=3040156 RepID=A0AAV9GV52_9PEZI|nr:hypothetical protein QBC34DRAFT_436193 [Podospora aff. communis PSN243]